MVRNIPSSLRILVILAASLGAAAVGLAGGKDCCCAHCGCAQCCKTCRLVCEEKKVEVVCWGAKCEDFCVPGPSCERCKHCKDVCAECGNLCDCTEPASAPKRFVWRDWCPSDCATIFTRTKLMKKTITVTVPSYKWVVEDLCPACCDDCGARPCDEASCAAEGDMADAPLDLPPSGEQAVLAERRAGLFKPASNAVQ